MGIAIFVGIEVEVCELGTCDSSSSRSSSGGVDILTSQEFYIAPVTCVGEVHTYAVVLRQVVCPVPYIPPSLFVTEEIFAVGRNLLWSWYLSCIAEFRHSIAIGDTSSSASVFPSSVVGLGSCSGIETVCNHTVVTLWYIDGDEARGGEIGINLSFCVI